QSVSVKKEGKAPNDLPRFACSPIDDAEAKVVDIDCVEVREFQEWSYHTRRLFETERQTPAEALVLQLSNQGKVSFFDPHDILFAEQLGFTVWGDKTKNGFKRDDRTGGHIANLSDAMKQIHPSKYGTTTLISFQLELMDLTAKASKHSSVH